MSQDVVVATCYATLGMDSVIKACKQGGVTVLVCNRKAMPAVLGQISEMPSLLAIVYTDVLCTPEEYAEKIKGPAVSALDCSPASFAAPCWCRGVLCRTAPRRAVPHRTAARSTT